MESSSPSDGELARAARNGDTAAFAVLAERHRPALRAVAISLLGYTDEADDAVQDAVLTALPRVRDLRDPDAAVPWLKAIVRNAARARLRVTRPLPIAELEPLLPASAEPGPDEVLDRAGAQAWVRDAVATLSEPVREVTVLRYFTDFSSYRQIAELCGIPQETVGSRLTEGRRTLARALRASVEAAHEDFTAAAASSRRDAAAAIEEGMRGGYDRIVRRWFHQDADLVVSGSPADRGMLVGMMDDTLGAGVRLRLRDATASRDVLVWETDLLNPASAPEHCPPAMIWLYRLRDGRPSRLSVAYRA